MIGFYDYTVIATYIGLLSSLMGMTFAVGGNYMTAIFCLAFSGLCDMFDGKIARTKKNRTEEEKRFGIQIDSLCDVICFGAFPVLICYCTGMQDILGRVILSLYGLASVIRLGYFNVKEEARQDETDEARKYYEGLPITTIAIVLPLLFVAQPFAGEHFVRILDVVMLLEAICMVAKFQLKKPDNKLLAGMVFVASMAVLKVLHVF